MKRLSQNEIANNADVIYRNNADVDVFYIYNKQANTCVASVCGFIQAVMHLVSFNNNSGGDITGDYEIRFN